MKKRMTKNGIHRIAEILMKELGEKRMKRTPLLVAIDGRCASGKTTLASCLQSATGCSVVHMDHFFLRPEQRTQQRLRQPGGNADWERIGQILPSLRKGEDVSYRPYDCRLQRLTEPVQIRTGKFILIEGSYSCHPQLWDFYDLRIFLSVEPEEQLRRIERRNGPQGKEIFRTRCIQMEERYFSAFRIAKRCDLYFRTEAWQPDEKTGQVSDRDQSRR